jgi:hypothetical protein
VKFPGLSYLSERCGTTYDISATNP